MPGRIRRITSTWAALVIAFTCRSSAISSAVLITRHSTISGWRSATSVWKRSMPSKRAGFAQLLLSVFLPFRSRSRVAWMAVTAVAISST